MKQIRRLAPSLLLVLLCGCTRSGIPGSGVAKTEARETEPFEKVLIAGMGRVGVVIGLEQSVQLTADDNLLPFLTTQVRDGTLVLKASERISPETPVRLEITIPELTGLEITGSGEGYVTGLDAETFRIAITGSGVVKPEGRTGHFEVIIIGSGDVRAEALQARDVSVNITGSGDVDLGESESLDVSITGGGDVRYAGDPRITQKIVGSGNLKKKDAAGKP